MCTSATVELNVNFIFKVYLLIYFERERESLQASKGGADIEGERKSQAGSMLSAQSPSWGLISGTTRS